MKTWAKPTIVVSKCLGETPCRYNGEASTSKGLLRLKPFVNIIEICPEEGIGLKTPRNAIRLISNNYTINLIDPKTMMNYTKSMTEFSEESCMEFSDLNPQGFLLKSRSPSCGLRDVKIYSSAEKGSSSIKGKGIFGKQVYETFFPLPIEEDGRLNNFSIREHFLTRIFTLAEFDEISKTKDMNSLVEFHTKNKLLFIGYSQCGAKRLGIIVANHDNLPVDDVFSIYHHELLKQIRKAPRYTSIINVFNHALGYFTEDLSKGEKEFFFETVEKYRLGKVPQSVPINLLKSYAIRFKNDYLLNQTFLEPYPEELIDLNDSGKGVVRD